MLRSAAYWAAMLLRLLVQAQQPVVFDTVRFNQIGSFALGFSVFPLDSGYLCFSVQKGPADQSQDVYITRFNTTGGVESEQAYESYQQDDYGNADPVVRANGGFYMGVTRFGILGILDSLFLYRFAADGDTIWTRFISVDSTWVVRHTSSAMNGDILLGGTHQYPDEAYVYHLDSLGNIKGYHGYQGFDGEDVVVGKDGSWFVCGLGNHQPNYGRAILLRSDTLGGEYWRYVDQSMYGRFVSMIALHDGGVVGLGSRNPLDSAQRANATKLDSSGNVAWIKDPWRTNIDSWYCRFHAGFETSDSSLVIAGWVRDTVNRDAGMLFKLNKEGDAIWRRFYTHYPGAAYGKDQIFWDVKPTSDGGMVLTGETNSDDYPYAQLWLLKLDSMGCLVPGCGSVGVEEYTDALQALLQVSPNPASEGVSVSLMLPSSIHINGQPRVVLLDAVGRVVGERELSLQGQRITGTVQVSTLPSGIYYLHLRDSKRWLAGAKVVVE